MAKRILLADDSITIQKVIELTFSDEDFEVVTVGNGRLAVERLAEVRPDVVLCDIIMPERDGYEVCDFVKRHPQFGQVPVLLLTGAFEPFDQERAQRVGADGYLAKPFEPETLIAKVKDLLARQSQRSAPAPPLRVPQAPPALAPPPAPTPVAAPAAPAPERQPPPPPPPMAPPVPVQVAPPPIQVTPAPFLVPPPPPSRPAIIAPPPVVASAPPAGLLGGLIPDEPFAGLDPNSLGAASPVAAQPERSPAPPDTFIVPPTPDATLITPEEAASLAPPAADDDGASTLFFRTATTWSQPTIEVPLEERARASLEAQHAVPPVFEEIVEEEVLEVQTGSFAAPPATKAEGPSSSGFESLVEDTSLRSTVAEEGRGSAEAEASVEDLVVEGLVPEHPTALEAKVSPHDEAAAEAPPSPAFQEEIAPLPAPTEFVSSAFLEQPPAPVLPPATQEVSAPPVESSEADRGTSSQPLSALAEAWIGDEALSPSDAQVASHARAELPEYFPLEAEAQVAPSEAESLVEDLPSYPAIEAAPEREASMTPVPAQDTGLSSAVEMPPGLAEEAASTSTDADISAAQSDVSGLVTAAEPTPEVVSADRPVEAAAEPAVSNAPGSAAGAPEVDASWADVAAEVTSVGQVAEPSAASVAGSVAVTPDMVQQIAQRVIAQVSEKVIREIAWEVIPEIAEALIKREIQRIRDEFDKTPPATS